MTFSPPNLSFQPLFCDTGDQLQGFRHGKQILQQLSPSSTTGSSILFYELTLLKRLGLLFAWHIWSLTMILVEKIYGLGPQAEGIPFVSRCLAVGQWATPSPKRLDGGIQLRQLETRL